MPRGADYDRPTDVWVAAAPQARWKTGRLRFTSTDPETERNSRE
jgi:hypothetical protein